ncbi:hypothetical protein HPB50_009285 [Hyalomma asiaticum]|uniref:Uncharacterized protein n=1 Tax=Hyalomma asiaticum TaxID=266040 RepID=A0ACB7TEK7_HYAAI|nr:hypothetical protein HPB50_009285 [Hyalomma asiaticum]
MSSAGSSDVNPTAGSTMMNARPGIDAWLPSFGEAASAVPPRSFRRFVWDGLPSTSLLFARGEGGLGGGAERRLDGIVHRSSYTTANQEAPAYWSLVVTMI